jgi:hypothetical protein
VGEETRTRGSPPLTKQLALALLHIIEQHANDDALLLAARYDLDVKQ